MPTNKIRMKVKGIRTVCCGKKRSSNQVEWHNGYDGSCYKCKQGCGCNRPTPLTERKTV